MPYKDPELQKAAQERSYQRNKDHIAARQKERRSEINLNRVELRRRRSEWVTSKKGIPCAYCKRSYPTCLMEFHHIRGEKIGSIGHLVKECASESTIAKEIDKCDLICIICHKLEHCDAPDAIDFALRYRDSQSGLAI